MKIIYSTDCKLSDAGTIKYGVPQRSILGPTPFNIYINVLFSLDSYGTIIDFADNMAIFYSANSWMEVNAKAEQNFSSNKGYLDSKLLLVNFEKQNFILA